MSKPIRFTAFVGASPSHLSPGLWAHPRHAATDYKDLRFWADLAKLLERGRFDALVLADSPVIPDIYGSSAAAAVRSGTRAPSLDPFMLISAMAHATRHLGFGVTASTAHEIPAVLARRLSSLDHFTKGRIAWNIVSEPSEGDESTDDPEAYEQAEEFLTLAYKLWEGSWEEGSVVRDRGTGVFADASKVHLVDHQGPHFQVQTIHLTEPSPQRTPLLFQTGASPRGRAFAGRHGEAVLLAGPSAAAIASAVRDVRQQAVGQGRAAGDISIFAQATLIVGRTRGEAQAKLDEYLTYVDVEGALVLLSQQSGIDLSGFAPDAPPPDALGNRLASLRGDVASPPDGQAPRTLRELAVRNAIGFGGALISGTPAEVADELQAWIAGADIDGFNLSYAVLPESYADVVELLVPELEARGLYPPAYGEGSLRARLQGEAGLRATHVGAGFRRQTAATHSVPLAPASPVAATGV